MPRDLLDERLDVSPRPVDRWAVRGQQHRLVAVEEEPEKWAERFYEALAGFRFLPAGRIIAGAGTERRNC